MELAEASAICRVLSDPHRLVILEQLMEREQCGSELLKNFTFSQPTLSHHMKIMVEGGLVTERREGKRTYYGVERRVWGYIVDLVGRRNNEKYWGECIIEEA